MKKPHILIKDARGGFRVYLIARNGEKLHNSEVLESAAAVAKNIAATGKVFSALPIVHMAPIYKGKDEQMIKYVNKYK